MSQEVDTTTQEAEATPAPRRPVGGPPARGAPRGPRSRPCRCVVVAASAARARAGSAGRAARSAPFAWTRWTRSTAATSADCVTTSRIAQRSRRGARPARARSTNGACQRPSSEPGFSPCCRPRASTSGSLCSTACGTCLRADGSGCSAHRSLPTTLTTAGPVQPIARTPEPVLTPAQVQDAG